MNSKCPVCGGPIMGRIDLNNNKNKIVSEAPILLPGARSTHQSVAFDESEILMMMIDHDILHRGTKPQRRAKENASRVPTIDFDLANCQVPGARSTHQSVAFDESEY